MALRTWTGAGDGTTWTDASNWDTGVPVTGDNALIDGGGAYTSITGTPSSDVLGTVTMLNGAGLTYLTLLTATSFVFDVTVGTISGYAVGGNLAGNFTLNANSFVVGAHSEITVTGNVTLNGTAFIRRCTVNGNVTLNDSSNIGVNYETVTVTGTITFNDTSYAPAYGTITGASSVTFNGSGYNAGIITSISGGVTLAGSSSNESTGAITSAITVKDSAYNNGNITGNATVRQHAAAFVAWRDYATSTYITGTLTLQFPEMDILGTGLL
jgi:hypothetical protein